MSRSAASSEGESSAPPWMGKSVASPLERMPLFGDMMTETARSWGEIFGHLAATPAEMAFKGLELARIESAIGRHGAGSTFVVVQAPEWGTEIALNFGRGFVTTLIEALFGGEGEETGGVTEAKLSPVERRVATVLSNQIIDAMRASFAERLATTFSFDRFHTKPDFGFLGRPGSMILAATFSAMALGRTVLLDVLIPQSAIEPFVDRLSVVSAKTASDPRWSRRLEVEVGRAMTTLSAAIDLPGMSLGSVARLQLGQILRLPIGAGSAVHLCSSDDDLFRCDLGQSGGFYTVRIEEALGTAPPHDAPVAEAS